MAAIRRCIGFHRYAFSIQYHGGLFLGFSSQGDQEDRLTSTVDLRGYRSIESCLAEALDTVTNHQWENLQVSSRTDRGVHAMKNTCHVDVRIPDACDRLLKGINKFMYGKSRSKTHGGFIQPYHGTTRTGRNDLRILAVKKAPELMINKFYVDDTRSSANENDTDLVTGLDNQPQWVDWNVRFSATQRTYLYRILNVTDNDVMVPFESDRSWMVRSKCLLNVEAMQQAAIHLVGEQDFTSFRSKGCRRSTPVMNVMDICVRHYPYQLGRWDLFPEYYESTGASGVTTPHTTSTEAQLITVLITGNAFLYRQVRNLVACLVAVGHGRLMANQIPMLLGAKNRGIVPGTAPPQGLFLFDVRHGDFDI